AVDGAHGRGDSGRDRPDHLLRARGAPGVSHTDGVAPGAPRQRRPTSRDRGRVPRRRHGRHRGHAESDDAAAGIEWGDDMVDVNRITTPANTRWSLIDRETGAANHAIDWRFRVG